MEDKVSQFYYKKSRLQQLKGFCYTVQKGNSKAAAEKMGLEPSAISLQIKSLEDDLGVKLFDRQGKKLILNDKGRTFYEKAVRLIQNADGLFEEFLLAEDEKYQNSLQIASFDTVLSKLVKYIAIFQKENLNVKFSLLNISKEEATRGLINKEIDLAIYPFWYNEEIALELKMTELAKYKSYWIMHKDHPLAKKDEDKIIKKDIANGGLAYIPELVTMKGFKNFIDEYNIKNKIYIKNGTLEILRNIVANNLAISILAGIYITERDRERFILKDTESFFPKRIYGCLYNKNIKDNARKFYKLLSKDTSFLNN